MGNGKKGQRYLFFLVGTKENLKPSCSGQFRACCRISMPVISSKCKPGVPDAAGTDAAGTGGCNSTMAPICPASTTTTKVNCNNRTTKSTKWGRWADSGDGTGAAPVADGDGTGAAPAAGAAPPPAGNDPASVTEQYPWLRLCVKCQSQSYWRERACLNPRCSVQYLLVLG